VAPNYSRKRKKQDLQRMIKERASSLQRLAHRFERSKGKERWKWFKETPSPEIFRQKAISSQSLDWSIQSHQFSDPQKPAKAKSIHSLFLSIISHGFVIKRVRYESTKGSQF